VPWVFCSYGGQWSDRSFNSGRAGQERSQADGTRQGRESLADCATVGDWLASDVALAAIREADTAVHLAGTLNPPDGNYENANIAPTERLAQALDPGRTRRLVFLSYVGASEKSRNRYLETKARAERLLRETQIPLTVFRCTHIIGSSEAPGPTASTMLLDGKSSVTVLDSGKQRVAPVFVGDVVAAILAALASDYSGTFDLQGPEEMTIDDLVCLLNRSDRVRNQPCSWTYRPLIPLPRTKVAERPH
jgi:nucleoside-diphosphate-sugar epimerase